MSKNLYKIIAVIVAIIGFSPFALALITTRSEQNVVPFQANEYSNGTTSLPWGDIVTRNLKVTGLSTGCVTNTSGVISSTGVACGSGSGGSGSVGTSTTPTIGQIPFWTTSGATPELLGSVATTSVTCTGSATCSSFTVIGASPITINAASGGSGTGTVGTSTALVSGQVDFSTGVSTIGNDSTFTFDTSLKNLGFSYGSTTALTISGNTYMSGLTAGKLLALDANKVVVATSTIGNNQLQNSSIVVTTASPLGGAGTIPLGGTLALTCTGCLTSAVTSVTGTWPIISSGGNTPALSFGWATTSQPSSSNLFVSNGSNGFYGVATTTLAGGGPITVSNSPVLIGSSGAVLGCTTATGSVAGCLSSSDWSTFNNKSSFPFSLLTNFNVAGVSTSTTVNFTNGLNASTTSQFANSSTSVASFLSASTTNLFINGQQFNNLLGTGLINSGNALTVSLANLTATDSSLTFSGSYNGSTARTVGINLGFTNNWTAVQQFANVMDVGTTTSNFGQLVIASTSPQLTLSNGAGIAQWSFANEGGNIYISTTTVSGNATSSLPAITWMGTTGREGLATSSPGTDLSIGSTNGINISSTATSSLGFGVNIRAGCFSIANVCLSSSAASLTGSTNQVAYFSGTNTAVGTSSLVILPSGNVGIGTTTLDTLLTVNGTTRIMSNSPTLPVSGTSLEMYYASNVLNGTPSAYLISYDRTNALYKPFTIDASTETFRNSGSAAMTITGSNVGIGTTTPASNLDVAGTPAAIGTSGNTNDSIFRIESNNSNDTGMFMGIQSGSPFGTFIQSRNRNIYSTNQPLLLNPNGGSIGMGTNNPLQMLDVRSAFANIDSGQLSLYTTDAVATDIGGKIVFGGNYTGTTPTTFAGIGGFKVNGTDGQYGGYLSFFTRTNGSSEAERGRFDTNGKFGIGTTTPNLQAMLDVASTSPAIDITDTNATTDAKHWMLSNNDGVFNIGTSSDSMIATTSALSMTAQANSQFGFGSTTPSSTFSIGTVAGTDAFDVGSSTANYFLIKQTGAVFAPKTASSGANQTGYWCYDASGQFIRDTTTCLVSARKFKMDIQPLDIGLSELLKVQPVMYYNKDTTFEKGQQIGVIADDVAKIDSRLVVYDNKGDIHGFNYEQFTAWITKAIQDFYGQFQKLVGRVSGLEAKVEKQQQEIDNLQTQINKLNQKIK